MEVYIVRHGVAENNSKSGTDEARELTSEGRQKMKEAASGFWQLDRKVERIFSSPLVRARQTAEILAKGAKVRVEDMAQLKPAYSPADVCKAIKELVKVQSVMLVGHEPNCSELASYLLTGTLALSIEFKKGAICLIETNDLEAQSGTLIFHLSPQALRTISGEEG